MGVEFQWDHDAIDDGWVLDDEPAVSVASAPAPAPAPAAVEAPRAEPRGYVRAVAGGVVIGAITMLSIAFAAGDTSSPRASSIDIDPGPIVSHEAREVRISATASETPAAAVQEPGFDDFYAAAAEAARMGRDEEALDAIDRALALRAQSGVGLDFKARLLLDMGEVWWALETANAAVMASPQRAASWMTKAEIHRELKGQQEAARFALERVIELAPSSRHAQRARTLLDEL